MTSETLHISIQLPMRTMIELYITYIISYLRVTPVLEPVPYRTKYLLSLVTIVDIELPMISILELPVTIGLKNYNISYY